MTDRDKDVLRLPMKHAPRAQTQQPTAADGQRLVNAQSMRNAIVAGLIAVIVFSVLWAMLSTLAGRIFPWLVLLLGLLVGLAIRRAGRGVDWRFPLVAALIAAAGSLLGNVVVAAAFTAPELGTTTLGVLSKVTSLTWPVFFAEVMTPADAVYAAFAGAVAAFYANRRLSRTEFLALRRWKDAG